MVELKWLIGISIIICLFCSIAAEAQVVQRKLPASDISGRDFYTQIRAKNHIWEVAIDYITIYRDVVLVDDWVVRSFPMREWSQIQLSEYLDQAKKAWINEGKKLITETSLEPSKEVSYETKKEAVEEIPEPAPKIGFDFFGITTDQKSVLYIFALFVMILILLVMKLANPLIMIAGIAGITAIFWVIFSSAPLIVPTALILFFFVFSIIGGKK